jgi:cytochrome c-type biogenesis protein CcmH
MAGAAEGGPKGPGTGLILMVVAVLLAGGAFAYRSLADGDDGVPALTPPTGRAALEARVSENPGDVAAWQQLGFLHFDEGRFAEAAAAYARAVELDPRSAVSWSSLGEARVMASERDPMPPGALEAFEKAIALDPQDPRARYFLAVNKDLAGDHRGAIADWLALYADTPPGAPWETDLKRTIEQVGAIHEIPVDVQIAAAEARRPSSGALGAIPGPTQEQIAAAASMPPSEQQAMAAGMVARLEARLASQPNDVEGWIMLMRSRQSLGESAKARAALDAAVRANPGARARLEQAARALGVQGVDR